MKRLQKIMSALVLAVYAISFAVIFCFLGFLLFLIYWTIDLYFKVKL